MAEVAQASQSESMLQRSFSTSLRGLRDPRARPWLVGAGLGLVVLFGALALRPPPQAPPLQGHRLREALASLPLAEPQEQQEPPEQADAPVAPGDESTQVMAALRDREIRALDVLLITRDEAGPMTWSAAHAHCAALRIRDLAGWRLPTLGELASMTQAGMLGRLPCWSSAAADTFGDEHMVWWGKRNRAYPHTDEAHVICVRSSSTQAE